MSKPEVRFKGYTEEWEERRLDAVADVRDGTHNSPHYLSTGHPFLTSKNVSGGYINYEGVQFISDDDLHLSTKTGHKL